MICVKEYSVMSECVERGIRYGLHRAYKHVDNPSEEDIMQQIHAAVMTEISEYFSFSEDHDAAYA